MTAGLDEVDQLGVGHGYAEVQVGLVGQATHSAAWLATVEAGFHPVAPVDLFGFGRATGQWGAPAAWETGLGARVHW